MKRPGLDACSVGWVMSPSVVRLWLSSVASSSAGVVGVGVGDAVEASGVEAVDVDHGR